MDGNELTIGAAILAGVIARAWGTWDARQRSASPPPRVAGTHWVAPARDIAAPWWMIAAGGLVLYSIAYAVAYLLGR